MSPKAARGDARLAARRMGIIRPAVLCWAVLACLVPARAMARDLVQPDRDLPCNDFCRAWMSWPREHQGGDDERPERRSEAQTRSAPPHERGAMARAPRPSVPVWGRALGEAGRSQPLETRRLARDEPAPAVRKTPLPSRDVPPRRLSALVSTPIEPVQAVPAVESSGSARPAADVDPSQDGTSDRLRPDLGSADAAVLARPLYQPPSITDVPPGRPDTPGGPSGGGTEPQAPDPVPARAEAGRDDREATDAPPAPAAGVAEPRVVPSVASLPAAGPSSPAPVAAVPPSRPPPPPEAVPATTAIPRRAAPVDAVPAPALPASDLERLDEAKRGERTIAVALPAAPLPPTAGVLLLGGLAVLSLVGVRRPRSASDPT